jgi:large subunit ribosomal protein L29
MKPQEVRDLSDDQLRDRLIALRKEALNLRFQQATAQLSSPARVKQVRRDVARIKTVMTERKRAAAEKKEA